MVSVDDAPIEFELTDADRVWFNVGSAPNLDITIDGVKLDYPIDAENEVYQHLWINIDRSEEQSD